MDVSMCFGSKAKHFEAIKQRNNNTNEQNKQSDCSVFGQFSAIRKENGKKAHTKERLTERIHARIQSVFGTPQRQNIFVICVIQSTKCLLSHFSSWLWHTVVCQHDWIQTKKKTQQTEKKEIKADILKKCDSFTTTTTSVAKHNASIRLSEQFVNIFLFFSMLGDDDDFDLFRIVFVFTLFSSFNSFYICY